MDSPLALGIDIGGTNTALGLVTRDGTITARGRMRTGEHADPTSFVAALAKEATRVLAQTTAPVAGCGIGAPNGNFYTGEILQAANLPWARGRVPLARMMEGALGLKVTVTNDANAAALGEGTYGAARGLKDYIVVTLGTGVGSGFVVGGKLLYGHDGFAGELGHVIAVRGGRPCGCGRQGCLETYASATGVVRTAQEWLMKRPEPTALHNHPRFSSFHIFDAAQKGDKLCREIFDYTGTILGQVLADAVAITSPQAIIFFGGLAKAGALILEPTKHAMEENLLSVFRGKVELKLSSLPDSDAAVLGASALV